jgi:uncharacterized UPF0160 family protein
MIYPDSGGSWRIQAVPVSPNSFESRKKLPEQWCGFRDQILSEKVNLVLYFVFFSLQFVLFIICFQGWN